MRCRGWQQEAALRMLENNLHPDVADLAAALGRLPPGRVPLDDHGTTGVHVGAADPEELEAPLAAGAR